MDRLGERLTHPGVLFFTRDQDVSAASRQQGRLEEHYVFPFAGWEVLKGIVDKRGQYAVAEAVGVPLPETFFPTNEQEAEEVVEQAPYPVIIKPAYHVRFSERFGVKGFVGRDPDEALRHFRRGSQSGYQMMVQEIIPGEADRLYTYASYIDPRGVPVGQFTGRKLRQNPRQFGTCRVGESYRAPNVAELGYKLLRALDFWGISQVEFKMDPRDGIFKLIEVNARNYQWQHLATACGVNLAFLAYQDALGYPVTPVNAPEYGRRWSLIASDLVLTPGEILRGETSFWSWLSSLRGVAVDGIFSWRDPKPGIKYVVDRFKRLLGRSA
jgi:predicted ATP-grasp superfamily ATP-dependent carboligase